MSCCVYNRVCHIEYGNGELACFLHFSTRRRVYNGREAWTDNEFAMGLRPTHGDESTQYQGSLIPNRLGRDFRGSVIRLLTTVGRERPYSS